MNTTIVAVTSVRNRRGDLLRAYAAEIASRLGLMTVESLDDAEAAKKLQVEGRLAFRVADLALPGVPTIVPQEEPLLCRAGILRDVFVPIGGDEAGPYAVERTLPFASALDARVTVFHSTWRKPHLASDVPLEHCRAQTKRNLAWAEERVAASGVPHAVLAGIHSDIVEGIILTALQARCCLIAVARSLHIGRGSHVDRIVTQSPIPVLVWR